MNLILFSKMDRFPFATRCEKAGLSLGAINKHNFRTKTATTARFLACDEGNAHDVFYEIFA